MSTLLFARGYVQKFIPTKNCKRTKQVVVHVDSQNCGSGLSHIISIICGDYREPYPNPSARVHYSWKWALFGATCSQRTTFFWFEVHYSGGCNCRPHLSDKHNHELCTRSPEGHRTRSECAPSVDGFQKASFS